MATCTSDVVDGVEVDYCVGNPNANIVTDVPARIAFSHSGTSTALAYLRSSIRIWVCSGTGMPTVCRYIVIRVDASLETLVSAEENCSHATTMVNPSRAP